MKTMWASFTSGTYQFLLQLTKKKPKFTFYFMRSGRSTIAYYEHKRKKSIFVSGKTYAILQSKGEIHPKGYVTMEHVPVTDDGIKLFEERVNNLFARLTDRTGVTAMRILKNSKQNEFVMMTQWKNKRYEQLWRDSPFYEEENIQQFARLSAYFAERPFTNEYYMIEDNDDPEEIDEGSF